MAWFWRTQKLEQKRRRLLDREQELAGSQNISHVTMSGSVRGEIGRFTTNVQGDQHIYQYAISIDGRRAVLLTTDRNDADILSHLPRAVGAAYNSSSNDDVDVAPTCLADTRVAVLKEIKAWAYGKDERCIFWLNGVAGMGKSTIARTICHDFSQKGHLGASFFFSRDEKKYRSHAACSPPLSLGSLVTVVDRL